MHSKTRIFSNFSHAVKTTSTCFRPDSEEQIDTAFNNINSVGILARGNGSSYSDCCMLDGGLVIDTSRLNHLLSFDPASGIVVCQASVTFADLFLLDPQFIPPVLPGTLHATLAGGVANDIHGKNNHLLGCFGHHVEWLEVQIGSKTLHCNREKNSDLFFATIAGLGLTGIIKRIAVRLRKASRFVNKTTEKHIGFTSVLQRMQEEGVLHEYQVAWLDLLNEPRALLSFADHNNSLDNSQTLSPPKSTHRVPQLPMRLIYPWLMKQFNRIYYHQTKTQQQTLPLWQFNNPLDCIKNWSYLYGKQGLLQFQAVFEAAEAEASLQKLHSLIQRHKAPATLAVLKYFTKPGPGLLSFVKPGFTLAIDFINNQPARQAIDAMNQLMSESAGRIYLAKDLLLNCEQFNTMYQSRDEFCAVLTKHNSPMRSDLGNRLGLNL